MRRMLLTAIAIVSFISSAVLLHHAAARVHMPPVRDAKAADTGFLQLAVNLCGNSGCVAVQVKRLDKHQLQKPAPNPAPNTVPQTLQQALSRTAS